MAADFPAIVIPAHKRPDDLRTLLHSVMLAKLNSGIEAPVVVSVDGDDSQVISVAHEFNRHGVEVRVHDRNLGLRQHILQCGDLCSEFGSVMVLEDDLILSPAAFSFVAAVLPKVREQEKVAALSLFNFQFSDFADCETFRTECRGDVFYAKTASSWGQVWWDDHWFEFREWLANDYDSAKGYRVPARVSSWPAQSWKKLFNFWLSERGFYSATPYHSLALCTGGERGTHVSGHIGAWFSQVRTLPGIVEVFQLENAMRLDEFLEFDTDGEALSVGTTGIMLSDIEFDLAGCKRQQDITKKYVFTRRKHSPAVTISQLDGSLGNPLLALAIGKSGTGLYLVKTGDFDSSADIQISDMELRLHIPWVPTRRLATTALRSIVRGLINAVS